MTSSDRRRPFLLPVLALAVLATAGGVAVGCSVSDATATIPVPAAPDARAAEHCRVLDRELPARVDGHEREDPEPRSELTAAWGDAAIVLRCGIPWSPELGDPEAEGDEVNGVSWATQELDDGGYRFTVILREAYVEVTLPAGYPGGANPLVDLAPAVKKAIPEGIAY